MKRQAVMPKRHGEERESSEESILSRIIKATNRAPRPSIDVKAETKAVATKVGSEVKTNLEAALSQAFGIKLEAGKEVSLAQKSEEYAQRVETPRSTQEFYEYSSQITRSERSSEGENSVAIRQQIEQIQVELKSLKDSSKELETAFRDVVIDDVPDKPGVYHLTFFEGFLTLVLKMKDKVEDGVVFAKLFKSRKKERGYSQMAKKHGTSFTLHHDRTPATQTG